MDINGQKPRDGERGATAVEVAVVLALILIVALVAIGAIGRYKLRSGHMMEEGPVGGGVKSLSPPSWVDVDKIPFPPENVTWPFDEARGKSMSPRRTIEPRATVRPTSSPNTGGVTKTPAPTQETAPTPGVEPPHQGPPDSG